jgi:putative ABC transport system permease protein
VQQVLLFALIAAALALAAACANVANAQLATVFDRRREIAVRVAMGASRRRIVRQWLTESLLVTAAAAVAGTLASLWLQDAAGSVGTPVGLENFAPALEFDRRLVAFSTLLVAVVTMLFGGLPAVRAANVDVAGPLKEESNSATGGARRAWAQAALVSAQVAVSVALLVSSAMLARSLSASRAFDVGFDTANLVIASPSMANVRMDAARSRAYYADTLPRLRALPGVTEVTLGAVVPLGFGGESRGVAIDGYTPPDGAATTILPMNVVGANYFQVMRIPVRRGRAFTAADQDPGAPVVAVINETMARQVWGGADPIGRTMRIGNTPPVEIVGVASDVTQRTPGEPPQPFFYLPFGPVPFPDGLTFHLRTSGDAAALLPALRRELRAFDARIQTRTVMPYEELRQLSLYPSRALVLVSGGFGLIALLLAVAGIYGVMIHVVTARRRELAVRLALGANPGALIASLLRDGLRWSAIGIAAGALMAVSLAQLLERFLFGVSTSDAASIAGAIALLLAASLAAAYAPARRIVRIDPASTLRS